MLKVIRLLRSVSFGKTGMLVGAGFPNTSLQIGSGRLFIRDGSKFALRSVVPDAIVVVGPLPDDTLQLIREKQSCLVNKSFHHIAATPAPEETESVSERARRIQNERRDSWR